MRFDYSEERTNRERQGYLEADMSQHDAPIASIADRRASRVFVTVALRVRDFAGRAPQS
jgi:hypothetical protein